jgi:hypothetical protein
MDQAVDYKDGAEAVKDMDQETGQRLRRSIKDMDQEIGEILNINSQGYSALLLANSMSISLHASALSGPTSGPPL